MPQLSIARLFDDNRSELKLTWLQGDRGSSPILDSQRIHSSSKGLIGHLNYIHPNWIQIFSHTEADYFTSLGELAAEQILAQMVADGPACFILSDGERAPPLLIEQAARMGIPILSSPIPSLQIIWVIRTYLGRELAEFVTRHGVLLDVLGMGVLLTGDSGVGKSELALELITRGSGLVADDVVELYHIAPQTLEGRCPEMLKDFLEVRGLGMLNIRTIFGETAVRIRKNLKLIVQLERPVKGTVPGLERLPLHASTEEIMGVAVRKVQLPVAAGRNLAVLVEAAVRNYVLQLRGIDSTHEFIRRQEQHLGDNDT
ncbi:MAG: HPr kinase/phosphorylase [Betaproteobacteria bacterium]|nr:HPr kinase/phosphorylase [Betaproteobacteria bacterium]MBL8532218.1 HPr kinase/phosphorylase [Betaproteobacteria bacterium]